MAVWFNGERVLGEIVDPVAAGTVPGGAIGGDFTGEEVLREASDGHNFSPGSERVGHHPFGAGSERSFRGWIVEARWVDGR